MSNCLWRTRQYFFQAVVSRRNVKRWLSTGSESKLTKLSEENGVRKIVLANPKTRNALSLAMMSDIIEDLTVNWNDPALRCIVILSEGPVFSSGHNLKELLIKGEKNEMEEMRSVFTCCSQLMKKIICAPVPVIAAVNGPAVAAGCQLVAQCDIAICTNKSTFATPGSRFGVFCSTPGIPLARAVPRKVATHMLFTGVPITSQEALKAGLVSKVVPDDKLDEGVSKICDAIKSQSRSVVELGKQFFYKQIESNLETAYRLGEEVMTTNVQLADGQEGISSFAEKRKPVWKHTFDKLSSA